MRSRPMNVALGLLLFTSSGFAADAPPSLNDGATKVGSDQSQVTAIDILLEPDATMLRHAQAVNARLLKVYPKGFALDATHRPHITMIQRFVRTADLDKLYAAAGKVLANANVTSMKLEAFKYYYIPSKDIGVSGIVARQTPALLKLQQELIAAVAPLHRRNRNLGGVRHDAG